VDLPADFVGRNNKKGERRAIKLDEIGPRIRLSVLKISEGMPGKEGSVIYHRFVNKSKKEIARQKAEHAAKAKLRKQRREEQERNIAAKKSGQPETDHASSSVDEEDAGADSDQDWDEEGDVEETGDSESEASSEEDDMISKPSARPSKKPRAR